MGNMFWWPRMGAGAAAAVTPTAPTLAVADNANGTGTATITGGDAGSTHTVYSQAIGSTTWVSRGSRTGNGTVSVDPDDGVYWWKCVATAGGSSDISNLVLQQITSGAVRVDASLDDILAAVATRIIDQLSGANTATCYLALNPDDIPSVNPGDLFYVVSPLSGQFPEGAFSGGSQNQCTVSTGFVVRVYSPVQLDIPQHDSEFFTHSTLGAIEKQRLLLKALAGWDPLNSDGNRMTDQPLFPSSQSYGRHNRELAYAEVVFSFPFDWDLVS